MTDTNRAGAEWGRLEAQRTHAAHWQHWGPYLSERAWGTVREDYSAEGNAWDYFPHDHARSKAYRWNEDGLCGVSDREQRLCLALALWNGHDPFLKERLFGVSGMEGNHGEDVKELYFYLDSTPTHSYMKMLYRYPQAAFPYKELVEENRRRDRFTGEYELADTGVLDEDRFFDVTVEYAKASPDDLLMRVTVVNRGPDPAELHLLPTAWFRNTWSWGEGQPRPRAHLERGGPAGQVTAGLFSADGAPAWLAAEGAPTALFTENESNNKRLYKGGKNVYPFVKDGIDAWVVKGDRHAVNPEQTGTKLAFHRALTLAPGETHVFKLRLSPEPTPAFGEDFDAIFALRLAEADAFYDDVLAGAAPGEPRAVARQALAGMLWSKQYYHYEVDSWLDGDAPPAPPSERLAGRNAGWRHLYNADIISMPDKWEYPWYAAWDLAFHCVPLALVDPEFAKGQLILLLREWYMHPNGQLPAYEWNFGDVNPPVHAWAAWRVYNIEREQTGKGDRAFLERIFHKLLLNFTWWVNRKDAQGNNLFEGGFLGLDNIGVFDRSSPLPTGGYIEQSDGTSWVAMYTLNMLTIALELARENPVYEDVASKFFEHFVAIDYALHHLMDDKTGLWDPEDGFYYDVLNLPNGSQVSMKVRSMVGLIPLFATATLDTELIERLPGFKRRMDWLLINRPAMFNHSEGILKAGQGGRRLLSLVDPEQLGSMLGYMLDPAEFLSPHGVRSLSRYHAEHPYTLAVDRHRYRVDYDPAESTSGLFGGNSNWRGPIWFPVNFLLIESLKTYAAYLGDDLRVECPVGSGHMLTLDEVARELSSRLAGLFLPGKDGRRPSDAPGQDGLLFYEYFHGDTGQGLGASHQTGWTGLVVNLLLP